MQTVVLAILGLVSIVVGFLISIILPDIKIFAWGLIAFGIILISSAAILNFRSVKGAVTSRRGKFSTSTTIMISIFAGIVILVNAVGVGAYHQFDVTSLSQFSLTSQTKGVLAKMTMTVTAKFFYNATDTTGVAAYGYSMLLEYQNFAPKLKIEMIDPDKNPEEARQYGITDSSLYNTIIFETTNPNQQNKVIQYPVFPSEIAQQAEYSFTNAILEVTGIVERSVYFLTGDGEATTSTTLTVVADVLKTNLLQVLPLNLQNSLKIPDNCALLIVAGPTLPMTDAERQVIADYLTAGNQALFMTNPNSPDDIAKILKPWGVDVQNGTIIDPTSHLTTNLSTPTVTKSRSASSLASLVTNSVFFPGATAIIPQTPAPTNMDLIPLAWTTPDAWMVQNYDPSKTPTFDAATETAQVWTIGVFITPSEILDSQGKSTGTYNPGPNIVVFGDSDFISDTNFYSGNNGDLFVYIVKALGAGTEIMPLDRKVLTTRRLVISPEATTFLNVSSIALLPAIVLIIGAIMWWRRR
jgi:ABC-type uncharacterized transport system involved in gliding motility auxiliary subunit